MLDNLLDPVILCFIVGIIGGLLKSDLRLPDQLYETLCIYLLFTIGLKGGVEFSNASFSAVIFPFSAAITLGISIPIIAYIILRRIGKLTTTDSASIAAHYGSVSAVTFAVVLSYLTLKGVAFESFVTVLLVILEIPAIAVGILIARTQAVPNSSDGGLNTKTDWASLLHEVFLGRTIYLLLGGLFVGYVAGPERIKMVSPVFFDMFKGALAIFLLEMGIITSRRFSDLKKTGVFLVGFGIGMPLISGTLGTVIGALSGLSVGGTTVLATLAASASYIAAPAAMRIALPKANPTLSLTPALGITFPFNIAFGIPIYYTLSVLVHTWKG